MKTTPRRILETFVVLLLILSIVYFLHIFIGNYLDLDLFANKINQSYLFNFWMSFAAYLLVIVTRKKASGNVGYIFLGSGFVKAIVFIALFIPLYKADNEMLFSEFSTFFIPFAIGLIVEVKSLTNILKET